MRKWIFYLIFSCIFAVIALMGPDKSSVNSNLKIVHFGTDHLNAYLIFNIGTPRTGRFHYVEHLAWLPNIGRGSGLAHRDTNAWTSHYSIGYWMSGKPEGLPDLMRKLAIVFKPISVPRDFAEQERDIILREYDLRIADSPDVRATEALDAFLYKGNALAQSVIGTPEQIRSMSFDEAKALHDATHRPDRARLVVIGNATERQVRDAVKQAGFPDLTGKPEDFVPPPFHLASPATETIDYPDPETSARMRWRKVVQLPEAIDFDVLDVRTKLLRDILDTNLPGGLAGPLRFDSFLAKSFDIAVYPIDERHIEMDFVAQPDEGVDFHALRKALENALSASAKGIPQETYDRVHERFQSFWPDWSNADDTARWMADYVVNRVSTLREPKTAIAVQGLDRQSTLHDLDQLLAALGLGMDAQVGLRKHQDTSNAQALAKMMQVRLEHGGASRLCGNDKRTLHLLGIVHPLASPEFGKNVPTKKFGCCK